jgi:hypothetical protein
MCYVEEKRSSSDPDRNNNYRSNFKFTTTKSKKTELVSKYIYKKEKIYNSWHMFNCKELFKL